MRVQDTGAGIAEEERTKVFAAFEQTHSGQQSREGTGLGLHLSQRLVWQLGGDITLSSHPGVGSTFAFNVPVEVALMSVSSARKRVIGFEADIVPKVLIVDDQAENRQWLAALLSQIGFQVDTATDGEHALAQWHAFAPDFIWMDVRLPGQDGFDTAKHIKNAAQGRNMPIVALTASDAATRDPRKQVFDAMMSKPVLEADILATLAYYLPLRYRYETLPMPAADTAPVAVQSSDVWALPDAWRDAFVTACQEANVSTLQDLIDKLPADAASIASALRALVDDFAYDTLEQLFTAVPLPPLKTLEQGIGQ